jgi:hypothetical protein
MSLRIIKMFSVALDDRLNDGFRCKECKLEVHELHKLHELQMVHEVQELQEMCMISYRR